MTLGQYDPGPRPKQDLKQLVSAVEELPLLSSSSQAVQLLPEKLTWGAASQAISMTLWAMAKSGYTGSAQPLLQSVTAAISQVLWHNKEVCMLLAERAAQMQQMMNGKDWTNSLYGLARLGYLDSSVRSLAAGVAKADLAAFTTQAIANLLYARSMFLALSIQQAVSSGHSQLASEPQLNSMAAALMSGAVAHVKLQQLANFDAAVLANKAVFDQLASDSERAAFMRDQVQASLPEAEAWRQLLQAEGEHLADQVEAPAAATPAAQQQQAVSMSAGQHAKQQGALPLPAAQAKSAGALPSQRAGQAPGLLPRPVRPRVVSLPARSEALPPESCLAAGRHTAGQHLGQAALVLAAITAPVVAGTH
ncbi:hypothetical protein HaLaN_09126 [Haematococcus lacustris]|uniref:Uncharacterized protein n=1 Tax=Haematococcus lacustris TaxID=44745 RepID=A0A699Z1X7_HAELA|nr:hypothetical protein HaLaN_09126 [Haematococcus lacustris]